MEKMIGKKKKANRHVGEKNGRKKGKKMILFTWNSKSRAAHEKLFFMADKDRTSVVSVCMSSVYFYLQVFLQCVSHLEHISRLHLFPELAANSW